MIFIYLSYNHELLLQLDILETWFYIPRPWSATWVLKSCLHAM